MKIKEEKSDIITYEPLLGSMPEPTFRRIIDLAKKLEKNITVTWNDEISITIYPDSNIFAVMQEYKERY